MLFAFGFRLPRLARAAAAPILAVLLLAMGLALDPAPAAAAGPCDAPVTSPIACENSKAGTPQSDWDTGAGGSDNILGFTTDISANKGETVRFKIKTSARAYTIEIFRIGYYGGDGARRITTISPSVSLPQTQPTCYTEAATSLIDCGNWAVSASWTVPSDAVSGIYFALLTRTDTQETNHIPFVVRDDASRSDLLFQASDTTWQAYNRYGMGSVYTADNTAGRAYKVSYNRPFTTRTCCDEDFVFSMEFPMIRWLERNGYDVTYSSGVDSDRRGSLIKNHKTFLSVGHDEYWSGAQRANVEAARNAGVNLAFFSGNEMFWRVRWENSKDGANTTYRTMVTYKETRDDAKIDPANEWTGTWRDPRFPQYAGANDPENGLTGTMYMVDCCAFPIQVPSADGKMRFWRNTTVASLASGQTATLAENTMGYEWDIDNDNGFRPPGLIRMSTTTASTPYVLQDYGKTTGQGTQTHHLTLYRHASGALVFSAGSIQWSWGLDTGGDASRGQDRPGEDVRMQQATMNLLADMSAQPATRQSNLVAATKSTDTTAPTATVTSPAANSSYRVGQTVTISGTATDGGGGKVGGVEVSTDGGQTWHPATTGRESWSYTWSANRLGSAQIRARAADDSGNLGAASSGVTVNVNCPCSIWGDAATPKMPADSDTAAIELGVKFRSDVDGFVNGIRFYKGAGNTGTHTGSLWDSNGNRIATATFSGETASGWQKVSFATPVAVTGGTTYVASYYAPNGHYAVDVDYFAGTGVDTPPLHALKTGVDGTNGVFRYDGGFPTNSVRNANYWVDVDFSTSTGPDTSAPRVTVQTPEPGTADVAVNTTVTATFNEAVTPTSSIRFTLATAAGANVAGTSAYNATTRVATFTPSAALAAGVTYNATVNGATDAAGNVMTTASTWSFTTAGPRVCPCSIFSDAATPDTAAVDDAGPVEVGLKFRTDVNGYISGARFYKGAGNTGTHTGSLWTAAGALLAKATFSGETATGWQKVNFDRPISVTAGTTYVVSYYAPAGHYSLTSNAFGAAGAGTAPIRALANGTDGGNGTYLYASGGGFPTASFNAANYWVDAVFTTDAGPADTTAPTVSDKTPAAGATNATPPTNVTATFNEGVLASSIQFTLTDAGVSVPAAVSYDPATRVATLDPNADLVVGKTYTASVRAADLSNNQMASALTWTFTVATPTCPCTIWPSTATPKVAADADTGAVELGVKFRADVAGWITGVRFYKGAGNTGTHTGSLWSATGTRLAVATFSGETASGWQQVSFDAPVKVNAATTYVASYFAPAGHYSVDVRGFNGAGAGNSPIKALASGTDGGNGLYRYGSTSSFPSSTFEDSNYWVDVVFTTAQPGTDATPPTLSARTPAAGATGVAATGNVTATFSEQVASASLAFTLRTAAGAAVAGTVAYDDLTKTASFNPTATLVAGATYTATVDATDLAGNRMAAPATWSFTVAAASCPCSIWAASAAPTTASSSDTQAIEVGVKFRADVDGQVTGIRFYKGTANVGTHVGSLWSSTGTRLATATFAAETASGWQQVSFAAPVAVTAGTTYVASYYAPNGGYAADAGFFTGTGAGAGPVRALASGTDGTNGVYAYGTGSFPTTSFNDGNYWVDVVFTATGGGTPTPGDTTAPTVTARTPAAGATGVSTTANLTATLSEDVSAAQFALTGPSAAVVAGTTSYNASTRVVTFDPTPTLAANTVYTATVSGARDAAGNVMTPATWTFTTGAAADSTAPTVTARTPAAGAVGVSATANLTATLSEAITAGTAQFALAAPGGAAVAGTTSYNATTRVVTFDPAASLTANTVYSATVSGATDAAGNVMTPATWTFTTDNCPCSIFTGNPTGSGTATTSTSIEPGVKFRADRSGYITGIRFYKASTNTGTHTGSLWSRTGTRLATGTFSNETASGWQTLTFSSPVAITAGTTYVASYRAPNGRYTYTLNGFNGQGAGSGPVKALANGVDGPNGVYRSNSGFPNTQFNSTNFWVDVVFRSSL